MQIIIIDYCKNKKLISIALVCSKHFSPKDIQKTFIDTFMNYSPRQKRKLKLDAIPSKNIPDVTIKVIVFIKLRMFSFSFIVL